MCQLLNWSMTCVIPTLMALKCCPYFGTPASSYFGVTHKLYIYNPDSYTNNLASAVTVTISFLYPTPPLFWSDICWCILYQWGYFSIRYILLSHTLYMHCCNWSVWLSYVKQVVLLCKWFLEVYSYDMLIIVFM